MTYMSERIRSPDPRQTCAYCGTDGRSDCEPSMPVCIVTERPNSAAKLGVAARFYCMNKPALLTNALSKVMISCVSTCIVMRLHMRQKLRPRLTHILSFCVHVYVCTR